LPGQSVEHFSTLGVVDSPFGGEQSRSVSGRLFSVAAARATDRGEFRRPYPQFVGCLSQFFAFLAGPAEGDGAESPEPRVPTDGVECRQRTLLAYGRGNCGAMERQNEEAAELSDAEGRLVVGSDMPKEGSESVGVARRSLL